MPTPKTPNPVPPPHRASQLDALTNALKAQKASNDAVSQAAAELAANRAAAPSSTPSTTTAGGPSASKS
jgi:type II secretory pathway component PulM